MSKNPFSNYANVVFPGKVKEEKKVLDKAGELGYNEHTENPVKEFNPDYKAFAIVRAGNKKYQLVSVEIDSVTGNTAGSTVIKEYDSEARAIKEMNQALAERSKLYGKMEFKNNV